MVRRLVTLAVAATLLACDRPQYPSAPSRLTPPGGADRTAAACVSPPAGLLAWWGGEGSPADRVGDNDGTAHNGVGYATGLVGSAFSFDGIDDFIDAGNDATLHFSGGAFTIMAWVKFNTLSHPPGENTGGAPPNDMSILDKMSATGVNTDGWRLLKQNDNRFWFCLGGISSNQCHASSHTLFSGTISAGTWYHLAVVKTDTTMAMYVNGAVVDSRALPAWLDSHSTSLRIGSYALQNAIPNGLIDEVQVYGRALAASEVEAIDAAGGSGLCRGAPVATLPDTLAVAVGARLTLPLSIAHEGGAGAGPFGWNVRWRLGSPGVASGEVTDTGAVAGVYRTFTGAGDFVTRAIVTDAAGVADTATAVLRVVEATDRPAATVTGDTTLSEGDSLILDASGSTDPNDLRLSFAWRFAGSAAGTAPSLRRVPVRGSHAYRVIVTNLAGLRDTVSGTVTVTNVAPTATWTRGTPSLEGRAFTMRVASVADATADLQAGIEVAFDCGTGYAAYGSSRTVSCTGLPDQGTWSRGVRLRDQLGAVREYRDTIDVANAAPAIAGLSLTGSGSSWTPRFTVTEVAGDAPFARYSVDGVRQGAQQAVTVLGSEFTGRTLTATTGQVITVRVFDKDGAQRAASITVP